MSVLALYPLTGIAVVMLAAIAIRLGFHHDRRIIRPIEPPQSAPGHQGLSAAYSWRRPIFLLFILLVTATWVAWQAWSVSRHYATDLKAFSIFFGVVALGQLAISTLARPHHLQAGSGNSKAFKTAIILPIYNESEHSLREGLESFFAQTQLPDEIHVVDDGSAHGYSKTQRWLIRTGKKHDVVTSWTTSHTNNGKRQAHSTAFEAISHDDDMIVITIDSDGLLDPHAIEEGLKPFHDPQVQSVAGVVIAKNAQNNFLSRITDLIFVSSQQLVDRSAMSQFGSVLVNSGGLAFYRIKVIQAALDHGYTEEMFFDRPVVFSDDSYLTLFALLNGRAVQQPSSIVFTDMPVKLGHHLRQQVRWNRGSFIRSWWRLKHLPINSYGYLRQIVGWGVFVSLTIILVELLIILPVAQNKLPPLELLGLPVVFSYLQAARYFAIKRSDMSRLSQWTIFALAPLAMAWSTIVLRSVRLYSIATCFKTGWGTRRTTEILHPMDDHA